MPEGPAGGRVEAKRRALTTPSPAPASSARWCDEPISTPTARVPCEQRRLPTPGFLAIHRLICSAKSGHEYMHTCGALIATDRCAQTWTCGTATDGVNDPVSAGWGHSSARTAGSFTPSFVQRLQHRHRH